MLTPPGASTAGEAINVDGDRAAAMVAGALKADALVILTEWQPYRRPDMDRVRALLRSPVVLDGRNLFEPVRMRDMGFEYYCVGRPAAAAVPAGGRE